jgi:hypothetical protein
MVTIERSQNELLGGQQQVSTGFSMFQISRAVAYYSALDSMRQDLILGYF